MNPLRESIQDYLALRRSLGFKLREAGICLAKFAAFLEARGATHLTTQLALEWAQRLGDVRSFARYHAASDPQTEILPPGLLPFHPRRARPYLYSEEEIAHLLRCALELPPVDGLRPLSYHCLLGLLSVTGLRIGEATHYTSPSISFNSRILVLAIGTRADSSPLTKM